MFDERRGGPWLLRLQQDGVMTQRQLVSSGAIWESVVGYSRAVRVGSWASVAGTTAAAEGGGAIGGANVGAQARETLRRIAAALEQAGAGLQDVVRTRIFVTDISSWQEVGQMTVHEIKRAGKKLQLLDVRA